MYTDELNHKTIFKSLKMNVISKYRCEDTMNIEKVTRANTHKHPLKTENSQ